MNEPEASGKGDGTAAGRPTLVVTPKIDLMVQWARELEQSFGVAVGMVGAGEFNYQPLTVTTYDSAYIHLEKWANRYGLVIFDECHHLPGPSYMEAANAGLAMLVRIGAVQAMAAPAPIRLSIFRLEMPSVASLLTGSTKSPPP